MYSVLEYLHIVSILACHKCKHDKKRIKTRRRYLIQSADKSLCKTTTAVVSTCRAGDRKNVCVTLDTRAIVCLVSVVVSCSWSLCSDLTVQLESDLVGVR